MSDMGNLPMLSDDCEEIQPGLSLSASGMLPGEKESLLSKNLCTRA